MEHTTTVRKGVLSTVLPVRKRNKTEGDRYQGLYFSIPSFIAENLQIEEGDQVGLDFTNVYRKPKMKDE